MNKKKLVLILSAFLILPVAALAFAPFPINTSGPTLNQLISRILDVVWVVFVVIAIILFVMSGILFLTSHGEPQKLTTARASFIWGVAGVVVGIVAFSIVKIVDNIL